MTEALIDCAQLTGGFVAFGAAVIALTLAMVACGWRGCYDD